MKEHKKICANCIHGGEQFKINNLTHLHCESPAMEHYHKTDDNATAWESLRVFGDTCDTFELKKITSRMKQKLINIINDAATGQLTVDDVATKCEELFNENQIGQQFSIFDEAVQTPKKSTHFDGSDIIVEFDHERLSKQLKCIYDLMIDEEWRTLRHIEWKTGYPQASISAQLRHLRKPKMGSHTVNKRRKGEAKSGLFEYQLLKKLL